MSQFTDLTQILPSKLIANNLLTLLNDKNYAKKQILEVKKTMPLLKDNDNLPSINAANEILKIE